MKIKNLLALSTAMVAVLAYPVLAASHREAPGVTEHPKIDATDFYMFRSYEPGREDFVTIIANYQPLQTPYGGPNYFTMDPDALYEIHIDNDGDAIEDLTFQFQFENSLVGDNAGIALNVGPEGQQETVAIPLRYAGEVDEVNNVVVSADQPADTLNEIERYSLTLVEGDRRSGTRSPILNGSSTLFSKPLDYVGGKTVAPYTPYAQRFEYGIAIPGCDATGAKVFVGQRRESFAVNLGPVFDLISFVPIEGFIEQDPENDDVARDFNVTSLALEVPISCLTSGDETVIGGWTTSSLPQGALENPTPGYEDTERFGGAFVQQSRLGMPLVNELVIGLPDKDRFNASEPVFDSQFLTYVTHPTFPELVEALFAGVELGDGSRLPEELAPNNFPRNDLVVTFLTGFPGVNQPANVAASEMLRLNTALPVTAQADQNRLGLLAEDVAGYPNGRRPFDDIVDITLRAALGVLCHPVPLAEELEELGVIESAETDLILLDLCGDEQPSVVAPVGTAAFTDGASLNSAASLGLQNEFPYLARPFAGAGPNTADNLRGTQE